MPSLTAQVYRQLEEDVIYLKNGSVIRGQLTAQEVRAYVEIELVGGEVMRLEHAEIERITREAAKYTRIRLRLSRSYRPIIYRSPRIYQLISWGFAANETQGQPNINSHLEYRVAYHLTNFLNVGVGTGLNPYEGGLILPVFGEIHGDLMRTKVSPHYLIQAGYGYGAGGSWRHREFDGGYMGHAALGATFHTRHKGEWIFTIGFKMQNTYQVFEEWPNIWNPTGQIQEPAIVEGNRRYQKIVWQISYAF
ncbi:MAG: hypothetical protein AAFR61_14405 [Bacteroidota bacterium]